MNLFRNVQKNCFLKCPRPIIYYQLLTISTSIFHFIIAEALAKKKNRCFGADAQRTEQKFSFIEPKECKSMTDPVVLILDEYFKNGEYKKSMKFDNFQFTTSGISPSEKHTISTKVEAAFNDDYKFKGYESGEMESAKMRRQAFLEMSIRKLKKKSSEMAIMFKNLMHSTGNMKTNTILISN